MLQHQKGKSRSERSEKPFWKPNQADHAKITFLLESFNTENVNKQKGIDFLRVFRLHKDGHHFTSNIRKWASTNQKRGHQLVLRFKTLVERKNGNECRHMYIYVPTLLVNVDSTVSRELRAAE